MKEFWRQLKCRVLHGHVMVCFGMERFADKSSIAWYGCARCGRCEPLTWVWDSAEMHHSERP